MAERTVQFSLNTAGTHWVARGRDPIPAPPWVDPPITTVFLLNDAGSVLDGPKVLS